MTNPIITVENLGKRYRVRRPGNREGSGLRHALEAGAKNLWKGLGRLVRGQAPFEAIPPEEEFWALKDVSFEVMPGECVGIIGRNGAGKSTLLKILSRITEPSAGRAIMRGRVGSLLEVGTGFHPELTGRENIFLNGTILGMRRHEILRSMEEIVAFAEVDAFLDTPVKHYSSGMYMRLAFAVAAHLDPEILIVDEVLAVGDAQFQKKCLGKMREVSRDGRTVIFVSHNMQAISTLCTRGVVLQHGNNVFIGDTEEAVSRYLSAASNGCSIGWTGDIGDDQVRLEATAVECGQNGLYRTDNPLRVFLRYTVRRRVLGLVVAVEIYNNLEQRLVYSAADDAKPPPAEPVDPGTYEWELTIPANTFAAGAYRIEFDIGIHNIRRIVRDAGTLNIELENLAGIGRRFMVSHNIIRPNWPWRLVNAPS